MAVVRKALSIPKTESTLERLSERELAWALFSCLLADANVSGDDRQVEETGDHVLNPDFAAPLSSVPLKPAAVLIAVNTAVEPVELVLTVRTSNLKAHPGQIAFPGGRIDGTETPKEAARREAWEEIRLQPEMVAHRGYLPSYASRTGYRVTPVVGEVESWGSLRPNPGEVESIFQVPLRFLLDPNNAELKTRVFDGKPRYFYNYLYDGRSIWGLTAGIIHHMSSRVQTQLET